jgi:hypothetical protein
VIYFADNGPNSWRWNGGMRGRKGSTDEGGVRAPMLVRWPARIKPGTVIPQIAAAIDLLPTLADVAEIPVISEKPLDGVSLKPLLLGNDETWPDRMIFSHWAGRVSVRTQQFRLDDAGKLSDMTEDPGQDKDVSNDHPEVAAKLRKAVAQCKQELLPGLGKEPRPFPVGYREFPVTHLPARDGVPHGNVQRSARAPNCSYFTNWTSTDDRITWDIEVANAGRYQAAVYYTCPKADVGSTFELAFQDARLQGKITEAHDPPLRGMENDRVDRGSESYVKDFKRLEVGEVELKKGRGELTLRALEVPGKQVMDVRYVVLTLVE